MGYKVPPDEVVVATITSVLEEHATVASQERLTDLVAERLRRIDPEYAIGPRRVRRLAIRSGYARIEIQTAKRAHGPPKTCPVCAGSLARIKNRTLEGRVIALEFRCARCGYWTGRTIRVPTRYVFHKKRGPGKPVRVRTLTGGLP